MRRPSGQHRRTALAAVLFCFGLALAVAACRRDAGNLAAAGDSLVLVTDSGRHPISLEIADTDEKKQVGLMFRTELADGHGMLFLHDRPQEITMWMKNTYISLDMVFIGADGAVVRVARSTEPMSEAIISSERPATAVLELKAGSADRYRITRKSRVEHPHFSSPR